MNKNEQTPGAPHVDEAFEPWEQVRPIPLFVIAVIFALALWGVLTYMSEHAAQQEAKTEARVDAMVASTAGAGILAVKGLKNADVATLQLVAVGRGQAWSCASCHGEAGQGNLSTPRLAGQPADYLAKQLGDFASGLRANESMAVVAKELSREEIANLAQYYAQIELKANLRPALGGDLQRGELIARQGDWKSDVPACVSCHGMSGEGVAPGFPALAGQQPGYIFAQLAAWHAGQRKNSPQKLMDDVAGRMSVDDMRAVADYFGSLPARDIGTPPSAAAAATTASLTPSKS